VEGERERERERDTEALVVESYLCSAITGVLSSECALFLRLHLCLCSRTTPRRRWNLPVQSSAAPSPHTPLVGTNGGELAGGGRTQEVNRFMWARGGVGSGFAPCLDPIGL
jgi:hypothetical protein